eukprot:g23438.t1
MTRDQSSCCFSLSSPPIHELQSHKAWSTPQSIQSLCSMASSEVPPQDGEPAGSSGGYPTAAGETVEPDVSAEQEERGHSRFGALLGSASSLKKKASPFLNKARQAIVEEAKQESSALHAVRQNLAMTAKDVSELRQEVMNEVRLSVNDIRQVWRVTRPLRWSPRKAAFRKAGDGLRSRLQEEKADPWWLQPSTCANVVHLETEQREHEAVERVKKLGGKLKGSIAKKSREVSSNMKSLAHDIRQKGQSWKAKDANASKQEEDEANLGDSIFAIGSDDDDWSDGWEGSDANSETPSTRSASRAEGDTLPEGPA